MTRRIELKSWPEPFEALWLREKTAEVRVDDRAYAVGDILRLREWYPEDSPLRTIRADSHVDGYTGRWIEAAVTHIERGFGLPRGLVVLSFERRAYGHGFGG